MEQAKQDAKARWEAWLAALSREDAEKLLRELKKQQKNRRFSENNACNFKKDVL